MSEGFEKRLEQIVRELLAGRRLRLRPKDASEREAIMAAARLAAAREPYARMSPAFRRRLAARLAAESARPDGAASGSITRRRALWAGVTAAAGALGGVGLTRWGDQLAGSYAESRPATLGVPAGVVDPHPGRWFDAGALADLPEGQAVRIQAGAVGAFLFRKGDTVRGMSSICTHLPCELSWQAKGALLVCPCHNRAFDSSGESAEADGYPLPTLPQVQVLVVDGRVQVLGA
ncbi:MAG TPA: Rieske 2Fe-2S domain-containing protein [Candidatus Dormibacteraeota bacterium]